MMINGALKLFAVFILTVSLKPVDVVIPHFQFNIFGAPDYGHHSAVYANDNS